jgi:2-aminoadipate transaminase
MEYQISENMKSLKGSAIREIFKIISKPDIISFAGGMPSPDTFPVEEVKEIVQRVLCDMPAICLQYGITEGYAPLIEKINERLKKQGTLKEDNVTITTAGGQQGLDLAAKCILNPGDTVIVEEPSFIGALNSFRTYGANLIGVKVLDDGLDLDRVEEILKENKTVKILYTIPTFQNPSGITMSEEKRKKLLSICKKYSVIIFEDNPYSELRFKGEQVPTIKALDKDNIVMYFGSFSKILSPGLRVGFVHGMGEIVEKMIVAKQVSDVHTAVLNQVIACEWMTNYDIDVHISKAKKLYGQKCELMLNEMDKHFPKSVKYTRPDGGIFIWCTLPEGYNAQEVVKKAIEKKVAFVPGPTFMTDIEKTSNCFRLNFSTMPDDKIVEGIIILAEVLTDVVK